MILKYCLPEVSVEFVQYETEAHRSLEVRPNTIFADFSPHSSQITDFVKAEAIVLDHHRTAKDIVGAFGPLGVFGDETTDPGVCGAVLVFREVCLPIIQAQGGNRSTVTRQLEDFATLSGIRDTWQRKSPRWQEACEQAAALDFWPWEYLDGLAGFSRALTPDDPQPFELARRIVAAYEQP